MPSEGRVWRQSDPAWGQQEIDGVAGGIDGCGSRYQPYQNCQFQFATDPIQVSVYACSPRITVSMNSRDRFARASTPSGFLGRGTRGSKIFSKASGIVRPVRRTGFNSL